MPSLRIFIFFCFWSIWQSSLAETVIHFTPLEDPSDKRLAYAMAVMDLALNKTQAKYGSYSFKPIPGAISIARSAHELNMDTYPNYFLPSGPNILELSHDNLISVDFPLDHGLLSYRICFVSPTAKAQIAQAKSIGELKKFTIGQGLNWPDVTILQNNGFQVEEVRNYVSLFKMVMGGRVDMFCRGISELHKEYESYKPLGNLQYDESFAFVYHMSYSLYFNKNSRPLVKRLEEGLAIAQKDGTLQQLFLKHHREELQFAQLKKRKLYYLKTPYDYHTSAAYDSYIVDPLRLEY